MYEEEVVEGCKWLDEHTPDWWKTVDLKTLWMGDYTNCTIGKTLGEMPSQALCADREFAIPRGFTISFDAPPRQTWWGFGKTVYAELSESDRKTQFRILTAAWIREILRRRKAATPAL